MCVGAPFIFKQQYQQIKIIGTSFRIPLHAQLGTSESSGLLWHKVVSQSCMVKWGDFLLIFCLLACFNMLIWIIVVSLLWKICLLCKFIAVVSEKILVRFYSLYLLRIKSGFFRISFQWILRNWSSLTFCSYLKYGLMQNCFF